ncbi:MAG: CHAT domain-containing protein [Roseobacter sp.]
MILYRLRAMCFVFSLGMLFASGAIAQSVDQMLRALVLAVSEQDIETARATITEVDRLAQQGALPPEHDLGEIYRFLAEMNEYVGPPAVGVALLERGLALVDARGGKDSETHFMLRADLTNALLFAGDVAAALDAGEALKTVLAAHGLDATGYAFKNQVSLGTAYLQVDEQEAALAAYKTALSKTPAEQRDPLLEIIARKGLAVFLAQADDPQEAVIHARRGSALAQDQHGQASPIALDFQIDLAFALIGIGDTNAAWSILETTFDTAMNALGPAHAITQRAAENIAFFNGAQPNPPSTGQNTRSDAERLAELEARAADATTAGDPQRLESTLLAIADLTRMSPDISLDRHAEALETLIMFYRAQDPDPQKAPQFLNTVVSVLEQDLGAGHRITLQMKRLAIDQRMSEVRNNALFVAQFGPEIFERLSAHRRFWDGRPETAFYSPTDVDIFRRYAEAHGPQDDFVSKLIATVRYAEVLNDVKRFDDAQRTLQALAITLEEKIAATGVIYEDLRVHVQRAQAQNLSAAGAYLPALEAYRATIPALFDTLRLSHMTVDALGDTITLMFGRAVGMDFAATAWLAQQTGGIMEPVPGSTLFEASQIAGFSSASAAVARSGLRRLMQNPELSDLAAQWRDMSRVSQPQADGPDLERDWFRAVALDNLRTAILQKAPEFYDMQVPDPVPLTALRDKDMLAEDEALIVILPATEFGDFADDPSLGGLVLAITDDDFAAAPIGLGSIELTLEIARLHAELDQRPLAEEVALRSEGTRAPVNPAIDTADTSPWQQSNFSFERAHRLYTGLFGAPEIQALIGDKAQWVVVAHGSAMSVPYAALVTQANNTSNAPSVEGLRNTRWLGLERALTIVPSVESWVSLKERTARQAPHTDNIAYLGVGDPAFEGVQTAALSNATTVLRRGVETRGASLRALPRLPGTRREVEGVSALFAGSARHVLLGADANEAALRSLHADGTLSKARILHFATHGLLAGAFDDLGEPALALSPPHDAQNPQNDGLLTASEAAELDLNAEWVILSACDTAGAESLNGDGLGGLAQGFFTAGAQSLLVSHWRVDDLAAERLATATIQLAEDGVPKAEALRQAMQILMNDKSRDHTPNSFAHPSQWAPFILVGTN